MGSILFILVCVGGATCMKYLDYTGLVLPSILAVVRAGHVDIVVVRFLCYPPQLVHYELHTALTHGNSTSKKTTCYLHSSSNVSQLFKNIIF